MSSLFPKKRMNQKSRLSSAESDEDNQEDEILSDFDNFDTKLKKKKSSSSSILAVKRTASTSQTPSNSQPLPPKRDTNTVIAIDLDENPEPIEKKPVEEEVDLSSTYAEFDQFVDNSNEKDQDMEALRLLKRKITDSTLPANKKATKSIDVTHDLTVESENGYHETLQRLYSIPKVMSHKERSEIVRQKSSSIQAIAPEEKPISVKMISIKTRLNGNDERKWHIPFHGSFLDFQKQISNLYGIPSSKFSLVFDGSRIDFEESPETLALENEDLLDIKIDKTMVEKALEQAKGK